MAAHKIPLHSGSSYRSPAPPRSKEGGRLYNSRRWRTVSRLFLQREDNGLCAACLSLGKVTPSAHVDHVQPHRGDPTLFWCEDNWQPLCASCHGVKTSIETRGTAAYPTLTGKPGHRVVLVCGPPGSGRLTWCHSNLNGFTLIDEAAVAAGYSGKPRHHASPQWCRAARAETHRMLRELSNQPEQLVVVVLECPTHGERREWVKRLNADETIIILKEADDCEESVASVALAWHARYTSGHGERVVRC